MFTRVFYNGIRLIYLNIINSDKLQMGDIDMNSEKTASEIAEAVIDGSSANAPGYLNGNPRRKEAEKERQDLKKKKLEQEAAFFDDLIDNLLIPKGLVTEKEKSFVFIQEKAADSKKFWEVWLENYNKLQDMDGKIPLKSYIDHEFDVKPSILLKEKMCSVPDNIFEMDFYFERLARFAADFQTEWKTPHFYMKKNQSGANVLKEEYETPRNIEAEQIALKIWDLIRDFDTVNTLVMDYYSKVLNELPGKTIDTENSKQIYMDIFGNARTAKVFEQKRFGLLKEYAQVLFLVKDNWEKRLERTYDNFTSFDDVSDSIDSILNNKIEQIDTMFT